MYFVVKLFFIFVFALTIDDSRQQQQQHVNPTNKDSVLDHLAFLGFVKKDDSNRKLGRLVDKENAIKESILKYQRFHRLKPTGVIDADTAKLMVTPRCGMPDLTERKIASMKAKWRKTDLTYEIINDFPGLNVKTIIDKAFSEWSRVSTLKFKQVTKSGDLKILFAPGNHNDGYPFDGKGGVLAHAFFPEDGKIHFDSDEKYTEKSSEGTDLLMVAIHEIGHSLGLDHTTAPGSIMNPYYNGYIANFELPEYDVMLIRDLYGGPATSTTTTKFMSSLKPGSSTTTTTTKSTITTARHHSTTTTKSNGKQIDAPISLYCLTDKKPIMMMNIKNENYVMDQNKTLWHYDPVKNKLNLNVNSTVYKSFTKELVVGSIDDHNVKWFFKSQNVWAFQDQKLKAGYPKQFIISRGVLFSFFTSHGLSFSNYEDITHLKEFPEILYNQVFPAHFRMDLAVFKNKKLYIVKEHLAYEFDRIAHKVTSLTVLSKLFPGLPEEFDLNAILHTQGFYYLFSKNTVYKFEEATQKMAKGYPKTAC